MAPFPHCPQNYEHGDKSEQTTTITGGIKYADALKKFRRNIIKVTTNV